MIQLLAELRLTIHQLLGFLGYGCLVLGVLTLIFSLLGGRIQGDKIMRAAVMIGAGAVLMNLVETYL